MPSERKNELKVKRRIWVKEKSTYAKYFKTKSKSVSDFLPMLTVKDLSRKMLLHVKARDITTHQDNYNDRI